MSEQDNKFKCFICQTRIEHSETADSNRCPKCNWDGGYAADPSAAEHLVFVSLTARALENCTDYMQDRRGLKIRVVATSREYALLEHGYQSRSEDGLLWRIAAKTDGIFWLLCTYLKGKRRFTRVDKKRIERLLLANLDPELLEKTAKNY